MNIFGQNRLNGTDARAKLEKSCNFDMFFYTKVCEGLFYQGGSMQNRS